MTQSSNDVSRRALGMAAVGIAALAGVSAAPKDARANWTPSRRMNRGYAEGPYGLVHYRDAGEGRPLVMLHQAPMSSRQFDNVYGPLAERGIRAIGIDTPGFGMSDPTDFVPTVEDWAKAIPPVLDHLGLDVVDLLGHHTGCLIATDVALQFPDRINNLIMAGPHPVTDEERARFLAGVEEREVNFVYKDDGSHLMESFANRFRMFGEEANAQLITRYAVEKFMGTGPFWYGHYAAINYIHNDKIPQIKHRTLILTNTGDQIYENALWAKRMRPDFDFVALEGGGVDIVDQQPEAWADKVAKFIGV